jgi:hypothetical protein
MSVKKQRNASRPEKRTGDATPEQPGCAAPTQEERAALFMLGYEDALAALEDEEPVAVAIATEYILEYSQKVGALLKEGRDYLNMLTPSAATPAIERIAMEVVLEAVEEELDGEE